MIDYFIKYISFFRTFSVRILILLSSKLMKRSIVRYEALSDEICYEYILPEISWWSFLSVKLFNTGQIKCLFKGSLLLL